MEMKEKNIDNLFKKGLLTHEIAPPEEVWANISSQLQKKKSKKLIVFWYRFAAGIAILATISLFLFKTINKDEYNIPLTGNTNQNPVEQQVASGKENKLSVADTKETAINKNNNKRKGNPISERIPTYKKSNDSKANSLTKKEATEKSSFLSIKNEHQFFSKENNIKTTEEDPYKTLAMLNAYLDKKIPQEKIQYKQHEFPVKEEVKPKKENQWELGGYYAPLYSYRALESGESDRSVSNSMTNNAEQGQYTYAGGLSINYKVSNKLSLGTGISVVNHSYEIANVTAISTYSNLAYFGEGRIEQKNSQIYSVSNSIGNIEPSSGTKTLYSNSDVSNWLPQSEGAVSLNNTMAMNALPDDQVIKQSFDYIEIPVLLRYKIIDKNLGLHMVSGISSYFLVNNRITIESPHQPDIKGKTTDIKTTNISGSLGLGLNYSLSQRLKVNMEPLFKIFLNSINKSNNVNTYPYSFGIYSGFFYSF